jgi:soluble lytic murein transglycosylase
LRGRASGDLKKFPEGDNLPVWLAAFSKPFADELGAAADAAKVERLLLFALSREESTFDPEIVSWAGATGLTQLMPDTAVGAYAAVFKGARLEDMSKLTDPALNLRLGAHVLRVGIKQFGGEVPLALAAYNAGAKLARATMPEKESVDFDLWVESIPIKETRRYVKRVVETWGKYRFLYDPDSPFLDLPDTVRPR